MTLNNDDLYRIASAFSQKRHQLEADQEHEWAIVEWEEYLELAKRLGLFNLRDVDCYNLDPFYK